MGGQSSVLMLLLRNRDRLRAVLAQKAREVIGYAPSVYRSCHDGPGVIFIHIPKCAGTSIAQALYGRSCWHWTAAELRFISPKKFDSYPKLAVVRNPWSRLYSAFKYAPLDLQRYGRSPLEFMTKYASFSDFVINGLTERIARYHYFLGRQLNHLMIGATLVDKLKIGRFEELDSFAAEASATLGRPLAILKLNSSSGHTPIEAAYTSSMMQKVGDLYRSDIEAFGYKFPT